MLWLFSLFLKEFLSLVCLNLYGKAFHNIAPLYLKLFQPTSVLNQSTFSYSWPCLIPPPSCSIHYDSSLNRMLGINGINRSVAKVQNLSSQPGMALMRGLGGALSQFYQAPPSTPNFLCTVSTFIISMTYFSVFFRQYDRFCPSKFYDTTHCQQLSNTSPPAFFVWYHHCSQHNLRHTLQPHL